MVLVIVDVWYTYHEHVVIGRIWYNYHQQMNNNMILWYIQGVYTYIQTFDAGDMSIFLNRKLHCVLNVPWDTLKPATCQGPTVPPQDPKDLLQQPTSETTMISRVSYKLINIWGFDQRRPRSRQSRRHLPEKTLWHTNVCQDSWGGYNLDVNSCAVTFRCSHLNSFGYDSLWN